MSSTIRIATRQSNLALWQTNWVASQLQATNPGLNVELVKITTKGDKILDRSLSKIGGKGLFVKELEQALLDDKADIAVHSLKDMPAIQPNGLVLSAYCEREDFRDVLISRDYNSLANMPLGSKIGTSSVRRMAQLKIYRQDFEIIFLRGNVDTRINKALDEDSEYDGIILACAGVKRLGKEELIRQHLPVSHFLPAPGQGIVTIESRQGDQKVHDILQSIKCQQTSLCAQAERAFNRVMGGNCSTPVAAHAELIEDDKLILHGQIATPDGTQQISSSLSGARDHAADIGERLAEEILNLGGSKIIADLNEHE